MAPELAVGVVLVALVLIAGGAEIYAQRQRRGALRERIQAEFASGARDVDRVRRAQMVLDTRRRRLDHGELAPTPVPVVEPALVPEPALLIEPLLPEHSAGA